MSKLFAIDSMSLFYRGYFAMIRTPLINSKGLNTGGIRLVLSQIIKIIEEEKPDYLAVVSDCSQPTFRHERFPEYKATREKMPDDLVEQLPYLPRLVESLNLPFLRLPGYEADDIVGTLMRECEERGVEGVMVTSDKDYMQLISEKISMINHKNEHVSIPEVYDKFGCTPEQVIDILGLMGDASDNIPGVRGVGQKTATKLVQQFGGIEQVYQNLESVKGKKLKDNLITGKEKAFLSRELVTINCHVPLTQDFEELHLGQSNLYDNPVFHDLLRELEFHTFLSRFEKKKSAKTNVTHTAPSSEDYFELETRGALKFYFKTLSKETPVAFALDCTRESAVSSKINGVSFSKKAGEAIFVPFWKKNGAFNTVAFKEVRKILESPDIPKVGYDLKSSFQELWNADIHPQAFTFDIMLASYLTSPPQTRHELEALMTQKLGKVRTHPYKKEAAQSAQLSMLPEEETESVNPFFFCENADSLLQLHSVFSTLLSRGEMEDLYDQVEIPLIQVLAQLECSGINLDLQQLKVVDQDFEDRLEALRSIIYALADEEFNINSILELQKVLYDKLKLHEKCKIKPKKIKTGNGFSTGEETLEKMTRFELPQRLLQYRTLNKLKTTYLNAMPSWLEKTTQKVHSTFNQAATATGRLSSDSPNLQNIPIRSESGRKIRELFVPSSSENILLSADYSQIELRVVAHYSKDPTFLEAFRHQKDIHTLTAAAIFKVPEAEVTREMRSSAKEVNFGLIYRMGADRLSIVTQSSKAEAQLFIENFFQKYSTIHALQEQFLEEARSKGYASTLMGRRRYLPEILAKGFSKRLAEGAAINTPIQGTAADIIKMAMLAVDKEIRKAKLNAKMILTVHDELVFDVPQSEAEPLTHLLKEAMENVMPLEVPLQIEVGSGKNWLSAH